MADSRLKDAKAVQDNMSAKRRLLPTKQVSAASFLARREDPMHLCRRIPLFDDRSCSALNHVIYGMYDLQWNMQGRSIGDVQKASRLILGLRDDVSACLNGQIIQDFHVRLSAGDRIEFMDVPRPNGRRLSRSIRFIASTIKAG
jgi:hypothetical protein